MEASNPIVALAERGLREQWEDERFQQEIQQLVARGITWGTLNEAVESVLTPDCPTPLLHLVGLITVSLALRGGDEPRAGVIHLVVANVLDERYDAVSLQLAVQHYEETRQYLEAGSTADCSALRNEGTARHRPAEELQNACALQTALLNESNARHRLAELGREAVANLERAVRLCAQARACFDPHSRDHGSTLLNEGNARHRLAKLGREAVANLEQAVDLYTQARACFDAHSPSCGRALMNEGTARQGLATLGREAVANLERAVRLCAQARACFDPHSHDCGHTLMNEGNARQRLATLGREALVNLERAVCCYEQARTCFDPHSHDSGGALMNEGAARQGLAELGREAVANLERAVCCYQQARACFDPHSPDFGGTLMNEGNARRCLAKLGPEAVANLEQTIRLYEQARARFYPHSPDYGRALANEGHALCDLARLSREPVADLERAVRLFQQALACFDAHSPDRGDALAGEGSARQTLAELGQEPMVNQKQAAALYEQARACFEVGSPDWGAIQRNLAYVLRRLTPSDEAYRCLREGLEVVEQMRSQMFREQDRIAFLQTMVGQYAEMVALCLDLAQASPTPAHQEEWRWQAWHWVHRGKCRTLLELLAGERPRLGDKAGGLLAELDQLGKAWSQWDRRFRRFQRANGDAIRAFQSTTPEPDLTQWPELANLVTQWNAARAAFDVKRGEVRQQLEATETPPRVEVPLPPVVHANLRELAGANGGTSQRPLLVEFFTLPKGELAVFLIPLWGEAAPVVETLSAAGQRVRDLVVTLLKASATMTNCTRSRRGPPEAPAPPDQQQAARAALDALPEAMGNLLIEPWAHHLSEWQPTELVLSPHFLLNLLPLHAAHWNGRPLIEQLPVAYLPSPALAGEIARQRKPLRGTALLLGNPTGDLPGADAEPTYVARWLQKKGVSARLFRRTKASTPRVDEHAPTAAVVHAACHSLLDAADFLMSGMELADQRFTALRALAALELRAAVLVYLSSCDSGQAQLGRTDELMALVRSFLSAGAPTVLASLWALDDEAAAAFADHFYGGWLRKNLSLGEAFRQAVLALKKDYPNPYYWAPFVLMGAWRGNGGSQS